MPRKENSSNSINRKALRHVCVMNSTLEQVSARWKIEVLYFISRDANRFSQLKNALPSISDELLGRRLRELTTEGLATKLVTTDGVVSYSTTAHGRELLTIIESLCNWVRNDFARGDLPVSHRHSRVKSD